MRLFSTLLKNWLEPQAKAKKVSLESRQTGSCGGMSTTELKIRIELILDGVDTGSIIKPVTELAVLSHALQSEFLNHLMELAELSMNHAYSFMLVYAPAIELMKTIEYEQWFKQIRQALLLGNMDDAENHINNYADFASKIDTSIVYFSDVADVLEKLVSSIHSHKLGISCPDLGTEQLAYTDGVQLFLPPSMSRFSSYHDNYLLYKIITFQLLGQLECETHLALDHIKQGMLDRGNRFLDVFTLIETLRINHYLKKTYPGIWKNILHIHKKLEITVYPDHVFSGDNQTSVFDSLDLITESKVEPALMELLPYKTNLSAEKLSRLTAKENPKQPMIISLPNDNIDVGQDNVANDNIAERIYLKNSSYGQTSPNITYANHDRWTMLDETWNQLQREHEKIKEERKQKDVYLYPEWDISLKQYRQDWCRVEEILLILQTDPPLLFDCSTLKFSEYQIKKTLDMIINNQKFIRYQNDGDEIDINAWVDAKSSKTKHTDDFQQIYIRNNKNNRSIAIMFALDISGSTAGWKNKIIKQSVWLLSRTLAKLDDQFAVYAFSGSGRQQCSIYRVKGFDENFSEIIKQRIAVLDAQQYTRMGAAIRHLSKKLNQTDAKTKILFVLTDGKPDDIDSYRGHYGVEDTRRAFNEAKALQLNPFVLTFDQEYMDYLPHMLGRNRYRLISDLAMLPIQISTIYKQLTA